MGSSAQQGGRNRRGWERLDDGLLPLVADRLPDQKNTGTARLVCR